MGVVEYYQDTKAGLRSCQLGWAVSWCLPDFRLLKSLQIAGVGTNFHLGHMLYPVQWRYFFASW